MTFEKLEYFETVARHLNFTRAAEECHIAQTAMSRHIAAMEEELGFRLFSRTNRTVELTAAGQYFLDDVRKILAQYQEAATRARNIQAGNRGTLSIGIGFYEHSFVSDLTRQFHTLYPSIELTIEQYGYHELIRHLLMGDLDIAFALPITAQYVTDTQVEVLPLFQSHTCLVADRKRLESGALSMDRLSEECLITISENQGPCTLGSLHDVLESRGLRFARYLQANSLKSMYLMVQTGLGVGFLPHFLQNELPDSIVMCKLGDYPLESFIAMTCWANENPALHLFRNILNGADELWERLENMEILS